MPPKNLARRPAVLAAAFVVFAASDLGSESVTLMTYYPAPSGVYTQMITTGLTYLARDTADPVTIGGVTQAASKLGVQGNATIGAGYAVVAAPPNGLAVQGAVGVGGASPGGMLSVAGGVGVGAGYFASAPPANGMIVQGSVGVGGVNPGGMLGVAGGAAVGAGYFGNAPPVNGLIVQGNVGIGAPNPTQRLVVAGGNAVVSSGYVHVNASGCAPIVSGGNDALCASGTQYATWTPGFWVEGWSFGDRGTPDELTTSALRVFCCPR